MMAMTAPVEMASTTPGRVTMRFFLPRSVVTSGVPEPLDNLVRVVTVAPATLAVLRFSGQLNEAVCAAHQEVLLNRLARSKWQATGQPSLLAYDPPFTIPFLRRNEVAVEVVPRRQ
jgi:SOUL heme-binding protein